MKLDYYPDTDSLYIALSGQTIVESREISDGVVLDYDAKGNSSTSTTPAPRWNSESSS